MSNEAVYWSTLVSERVPKWGLVDAIDIVPLRIVDANKEEKLNQVLNFNFLSNGIFKLFFKGGN